MPVPNSEIAEKLNQVADLLEIDGANQFRVRAYRDAAMTITGLPHSASEMIAEGNDLTGLSGIGEDMAGKIKEIVETGKLGQLEELEERLPASLSDMMEIPGLGPKRVSRLYEELGISRLGELKQAARAHKVRELGGFGQKTEQKILSELERFEGEEKRVMLPKAIEIAEPLAEYMRKNSKVEQFAVAGSYRRRKETVGDLDMVAACAVDDRDAVIQRFLDYENVSEIIEKGETRVRVKTRTGMNVDLRVVNPEEFGAAMLYFTGSRTHVIKLRKQALDMELKINEYGVFRGNKRIAGKTEEDIYGVFDLPLIPPELREDHGEFKAARNGKLPRLIELADMRGDLQMHTTSSDGKDSLEKMVDHAREMEYDYIAITDHSKHIGIVHGLDETELARQGEKIDRLNEKYKGFSILKGCEVDILEDGSLALEDEALEKLDLVLGSVHSHFDLSREKQTERILRALDNPHLNILAHPTGRRINERLPYDVDLEKIMQAARERGVVLEINANPERLDLKDIYIQLAVEMGIKLVISTDAHRTSNLDFMRYGVWQARRGWAKADNVINTHDLKKLRKLLKRD